MSDEEPALEPDASGSGLAAEKAKRLDKIAALRAAGNNPYPYRYDRTHTLDQLRAQFDALEPGSETDQRVSVAGRMMLRRQQGKLIFATLLDRGGEVQLFVSKSVIGDEGFEAFGEFDLGDWLGAEGTVMTTRKGELSVKVDRVELLAKAVRPMFDKWHGLTDTDT